FLAGGVVAELWMRRREFGWHPRRATFVVLITLVVAQVAGQLAPSGRDIGRSLRIAAVQGGGPQGVLAINSNPRDVIDRHIEATTLLDDRAAGDTQPTRAGSSVSITTRDIDLVLWPENTVDVRDFSVSKVRQELIVEAQRIDAPFAIGVTEDAGDNFTNAQIVMDQDGNETSRYDKVQRVPYGEYVPLRNLLQSLGAPVNRIPRDAVAGSAIAIIEVPHESATVPLAVAISWEVFFSARALEGVNAGGQVLLNPTNGSSYTGEILQQQQVATSQLRALESGRWVVQAATTGYSMFVDHDGHILDRISIGKQAVIVRDIPLRTGRTIYSYLGDGSIATAMLLFLVGVSWRARRRLAVGV
ncbi:MAG: apolipoprotein N-acyltransferase, partial [Actinomycetota bacterium]